MNSTVVLLIGVTTLLAALFFFVGYGITIIQAYQQKSKFLYLSVIYFIGSFFFLLYGIFIMFQSVKRTST